MNRVHRPVWLWLRWCMLTRVRWQEHTDSIWQVTLSPSFWDGLPLRYNPQPLFDVFFLPKKAMRHKAADREVHEWEFGLAVLCWLNRTCTASISIQLVCTIHRWRPLKKNSHLTCSIQQRLDPQADIPKLGGKPT